MDHFSFFVFPAPAPVQSTRIWNGERSNLSNSESTCFWIFQGLPVIAIGVGLSTYDKASVRILIFISASSSAKNMNKSEKKREIR